MACLLFLLFLFVHLFLFVSLRYMRTVTAVDAEWLAELGPMFFSIKESFETRMKKKRAQAAEKKLMEEEFKEKKSEVRGMGGGRTPNCTPSSTTLYIRVCVMINNRGPHHHT